MKDGLLRWSIMFIGLVLIGLIFTGHSLAKIDLKTLEGLWLFDDAKNPYKDYSGKGLDGKETGNPKLIEGKFGKAVYFDGKSYITIPPHTNPTKAITVSAWAKSDAAAWNTYGWILEKRDAYIIHPNQGSNAVAFCIVNGGPWNKPKSWNDGSVGPKDITVWHLYTCTFDSATGDWNIYIDGRVESNMKLDKAEIAPDNGPVHIGWDEAGGDRLGIGAVDEAAVFNVALDANDVKSLMDGFKILSAVEPVDKLSVTWAGIKTQK